MTVTKQSSMSVKSVQTIGSNKSFQCSPFANEDQSLTFNEETVTAVSCNTAAQTHQLLWLFLITGPLVHSHDTTNM